MRRHRHCKSIWVSFAFTWVLLISHSVLKQWTISSATFGGSADGLALSLKGKCRGSYLVQVASGEAHQNRVRVRHLTFFVIALPM
jgi:hypothetical protein